MKIIFSLIFFMLISLQRQFAQEITQKDNLHILPSKKAARKTRRSLRARYLEVGLGVTSHKLQDFAVSPLYYKGPLFVGNFNYKVQGDDLAWAIFTNGSLGIITADQSRTPTTIISPQIISYYMRKCKRLTGQKIRTYLGAYLMTGGNFRINNGF